jgi:hypothetical protein
VIGASSAKLLILSLGARRRGPQPLHFELLRRLQGDVAAAKDHDVARAALVVPDPSFGVLDVARLAEEIDLVALQELRLATWDQRPVVAAHGDHQCAVQLPGAVPQSTPIERRSVVDRHDPQGHLTTEEVLDLHGLIATHDLGDGLRSKILEAQDLVEEQVAAQELGVALVVRLVLDAKDGVLGPHAPRHQRAEHVDLIAVRDAEHEIAKTCLGGVECGRMRRIALDRLHVERLLHVADRRLAGIQHGDGVPGLGQRLREVVAHLSDSDDQDFHAFLPDVLLPEGDRLQRRRRSITACRAGFRATFARHQDLHHRGQGSTLSRSAKAKTR